MEDPAKAAGKHIHIRIGEGAAEVRRKDGPPVVVDGDISAQSRWKLLRRCQMPLDAVAAKNSLRLLAAAVHCCCYLLT